MQSTAEFPGPGRIHANQETSMPASIDSFQAKVYQGDRADALAAGWHPVPPTA